ncbi:putative two-component system response regulator [Ruminococcus sp. YRD2003]|uniref:HD domain-containing phosphohydrolase n=1 Tax=Ruminococcus sp. YRD2003 TaxID=1452313 RepID=UPI0008D2F89F|nr:putative two-component system response regulator [Ruminococcus flavefaciens]
MVAAYYSVLFLLSIVFLVVYVFMWHKHFDITLTMIFTFISISCLGYVMYSHSETIGESILSNKIIYLGASFLQYFIMLSILNMCEIKLSKCVKDLLFICCMVLYGSVLSIGHTTIFYKSISFSIVDGNPELTREYGFMHTVFLAMIVLFFIISFVAIIYSFFKKKQIPRSIIYLLFLPYVFSILSYFVGRTLVKKLDIIPVAYIFAEVIYLLISYRLCLYDIDDTVVDSLVQNGETGFIAFDLKQRYIGSNETAKKILPVLGELYVDERINNEKASNILGWLSSFTKNVYEHEFIHELHSESDPASDRIYIANVSYLYDGVKKRGYMVTLTDDTQNRKYIQLLDHYNEDLQNEVDEKTRHIVEMHDNLIMSLAAMVESRDNSTGGHIKRTSIGVRILIDEIQKSGKMHLSDEFCRNIIKAAPMHDLGKIAVDDAVLRKPGRFTPEEFEKMKHHSAEGARVIHEILLKTDDESFKLIAENVAHYHHERWDGSGYPDGLTGENIPIEARIMAIADVYDALVSKRVYKDSMSFEKANDIITSGMGSQFDPSLEPYYKSARPRLEAYYNSIDH